MEPDDGFKPLLADSQADGDSQSLENLAEALEDFSTGLVGSANPSTAQAPVYVYVDDVPLTSAEGARTFEHDTTRTASAQWHCKHVKIAQLILLTTSSIQFLMGLILCMAYIGVLPLASSVLGIMASTEYFLGEASSLEKTLNAGGIVGDVGTMFAAAQYLVLASFYGAIATPLNLIFDLIYLLTEIETEFLIPILDVLAVVFFAQAAAFLWVSVRARRVKKLLYPNST